ncbi:MAG TPA: Vms1/Ankzf1 family peptidyl-tRNA hydrolase [Kineosporiaceae bacterium]|nr:Vms1/Ankzf1 family peptidyl-tRNA hydrolase [Kineosporiaceae bacterium]
MNLSSLRPALTDIGPTTTVWIDSRRGDETGGHEVPVRWESLAERLRDLGAPDADLAALAEPATAPTGRPDPSSRVMAARDGRVLLDQVLVTTPPDAVGMVAFEQVPDVGPVVRARQFQVAFVVARIDRTGADIDVFSALGAPAQEVEQIRGETLHIHKVRVGGWAQLRFQHHTEEVWRRNAEEVAAAIHATAQEHGVTLLVLGGDVRARTLVAEYLPKEPVGQGYEVLEVEGDVRAAGASDEALDQAVHRAVAARMTREVDGALDRLRAARSPAHDGTRTGTAAEDVDRTVAAFQQGRVALLLLDPSALRHRRLEVGAGPYDVAVPGGPRPWDGEAVSVPADLALLRAAVLTDADVVLVRDADLDVPDGAAALLRWGEPEGRTTEARDGVRLP